MTRYLIGRSIAAIISIVGLGLTLIGCYIMIISSDRELLTGISMSIEAETLLFGAPTWVFIIPGIIVLLAGLIIVAVGQILRAVLHTANNSFEILEIMTDNADNREPEDESSAQLYKPWLNR